MRRLLSALVMMLVVISIVAVAVEARTNLNGAYAFTTEQSCTVANSPFGTDANGAPSVIPTGGVFRQLTVNTGIFTFNGDGTGTNVGQARSMNITNTSVGASIFSISEFSGPFTYSVNDDNTVDINFGVSTFTTVAGGGTGNTGTVTGGSRQLLIGNGGNTLVGQGGDIEQETLTLNILKDGTITQYRICTRSSTLVRN
jgi:hypothetical protein